MRQRQEGRDHTPARVLHCEAAASEKRARSSKGGVCEAQARRERLCSSDSGVGEAEARRKRPCSSKGGDCKAERPSQEL